jgi:GNAT superfamily N-acetyltransferase
MQFIIRGIVGDDWVEYRAIRLEMLRDTPSAYSESLDSALALSDDAWRTRAEAAPASAVGQPVMSARFAAIAADGRWVGSMGGYVDGDHGPVLVGVYVAPDFRGDAVGVTTSLLNAVEEWARGHSRTLRLDVHESNARAIASYTKRGYRLTGSSTPYVLDPTERELEMVKELG